MTQFAVGDYIVMKRGAPYTWTRYKSTGTIIAVNEDNGTLEVAYDYLSGGNLRDKTFVVGMEHCKLAKQISAQERVCNKIKQMEERWIKYQQLKAGKRSCHVPNW